MKKKRSVKNQPWIKWLLKLYWATVAITLVSVIAHYVVSWSASFASTDTPEPTALPFNDYFCRVVIGTSSSIVLGLVVLMLLVSGVVYMISLGQSGGETGITTAKGMILAAITGLALYLLGTWLLGDCGFKLGGWIFSLFNIGGGSSGGGASGGGGGGW